MKVSIARKMETSPTNLMITMMTMMISNRLLRKREEIKTIEAEAPEEVEEEEIDKIEEIDMIEEILVRILAEASMSKDLKRNLEWKKK